MQVHNNLKNNDMKITELNGLRQIEAENGKVLRKGDTYFSRSIMLPSESESDYEECYEPNEELEQAKADKIAEIIAYDSSDKVNNFIINGVINGWLTPEERANYKNSIESDDLLYSKGIINKTTITFKISGYQVSLERTDSKIMLAQIQNYADSCWLVTDNHKDAVKAMTDIDSVNSFDVSKGYPPMLNLTLQL